MAKSANCSSNHRRRSRVDYAVRTLHRDPAQRGRSGGRCSSCNSAQQAAPCPSVDHDPRSPATWWSVNGTTWAVIEAPTPPSSAGLASYRRERRQRRRAPDRLRLGYRAQPVRQAMSNGWAISVVVRQTVGDGCFPSNSTCCWARAASADARSTPPGRVPPPIRSRTASSFHGGRRPTPTLVATSHHQRERSPTSGRITGVSQRLSLVADFQQHPARWSCPAPRSPCRGDMMEPRSAFTMLRQ